MKFSVVIPVYNVFVELPQAIDSLKRQTFHDFEIVLVDDGSTDGCSQLVDSYANIATVIHQPNSGVVVARKKGFQASRGDRILFVDGDDRLKPETLACIAAEVERTDPDIVQFGYEVIHKKERNCVSPSEGGFHYIDELLARMRKTPLEFIGMCIGSKCYRRDIVAKAFADVGDMHIPICEDGLFAFAAFLRSKSISFLPICCYLYIQRDGSAVHRKDLMIVEAQELFISRLNELAHASGRLTGEQIAKCYNHHCYEAACSIFLTLRRNQSGSKACLVALRKMNRSCFFARTNHEVNTIRRKMLWWLLTHPWICCLMGPVIDHVCLRGRK